jgi:hypothetical protein
VKSTLTLGFRDPKDSRPEEP